LLNEPSDYNIMDTNKYALRGKAKEVGIAYLFWFLLGAHYAYLGKWGLQILFWFTLGGLGIWALIDLFLIPGKVEDYNAVIYDALDKIDKEEKEEDHRRHLESLKAMSNKD